MNKAVWKIPSLPAQTQADHLTSVLLSKDNINYNLDQFHAINPDRAIFPVLKSNAYGHGAKEIAMMISPDEHPYIVVQTLTEAMELNSYWDGDILVIGVLPPGDLPDFDNRSITVSVHTLDGLNQLRRSGKKIQFHLAINSGMNREGLSPDHFPAFVKNISTDAMNQMTGVWSHFGNATDTDISDCQDQEARFSTFLDTLFNAGIKPKWIHLANTPGATKTTDNRINAMRLGGGLYGYDKSGMVDNIKPVMAFHTKIAHVQNVTAGQPVGYGRSYITDRDQKIAILPAGYHEGVVSNLRHVTAISTNDKMIQFPILGHICMNYTIVDITDSDLALGDRVIIYSHDKTATHSIKNISARLDIPIYEILTRIQANLPRQVV